MSTILGVNFLYKMARMFLSCNLKIYLFTLRSNHWNNDCSSWTKLSKAFLYSLAFSLYYSLSSSKCFFKCTSLGVNSSCFLETLFLAFPVPVPLFLALAWPPWSLLAFAWLREFWKFWCSLSLDLLLLWLVSREGCLEKVVTLFRLWFNLFFLFFSLSFTTKVFCFISLVLLMMGCCLNTMDDKGLLLGFTLLKSLMGSSFNTELSFYFIKSSLRLTTDSLPRSRSRLLSRLSRLSFANW